MTTTVPELVLPLHKTQYYALNAPAQEVLFGGAAGGGKSYLLRAAAIIWCMAVPGLQVYLFRRTYDDLHKNHMEGANNFHELLAPLVQAGLCSIVENQIRFWNRAKINLSHGSNYKTIVERYQGREINALLMDEATHFSEQEYRYLRGRCRISFEVPDHVPWKFPRVLAGTNPGGRGHHYWKDGFVDHEAFTLHKAPELDGGRDRMFIPSKLTDNPTMTKYDPNYASTLSGLGDPLLVKALRDGDWNVIAGSMFADKWRQEMHVIDPFPIPFNWPIWRGGDDGYAAPAAVSWLTKDPLFGTQFVIAELLQAKMTAPVFAERTLAIDRCIPKIDASGEIYLNYEEISGAMDTASFANTGQSKESRGAQMNALGTRWQKTVKSKDARVMDVQNMQRLLDPNPNDPRNRPGIMFFRHCRNHIKAIPALMRDEKKPEDVDTADKYDHLWDSTRYALSAASSGSGLRKRRGV